MDNVEIYERVARLERSAEEHARNAQRAAELARSDRLRAEEHFKTIEDELAAVRRDLSRYRGTVGGILLAVTSVFTFMKLFGEQITAFLKGPA